MSETMMADSQEQTTGQGAAVPLEFLLSLLLGGGLVIMLGIMAVWGADPDDQRRHEDLAATIESVDLETARIVDHADLAGTTHLVYAKHADHVKAILIEDGEEFDIWNYCAFSKQHVTQGFVGAESFLRDGERWQRWDTLGGGLLAKRAGPAALAQCEDLVEHLGLDAYASYRGRL
jgi:hypothetical protein